MPGVYDGEEPSAGHLGHAAGSETGERNDTTMSDFAAPPVGINITSDLTEPIITVAGSIVMKPATKENPVQFVIATELAIVCTPSMLGIKLDDPANLDVELRLATSIAHLERTIHEARGVALFQEANRRLNELHADDVPF